MTFGLGILTNDYHWLLQSLLWMMDNMVLTCSNMLIYVDILKETMQGCTSLRYIRNNGPITLEITRKNTSHLVEEQLAVAGMFSTS